VCWHTACLAHAGWWTTMDDRLLTVREVAERLRSSTETVRR
jgi:hypothetical protein